MAGKPINLGQARKRKAKEAAAKLAETNRVLHGLSAEERNAAEHMRDRQTRSLDSHKREAEP